jgi:hypothetical protein
MSTGNIWTSEVTMPLPERLKTNGCSKCDRGSGSVTEKVQRTREPNQWFMTM